MGWGDEIMLTADARRAQQKNPLPVVVRGRNGEARWHPIWEHNPRLLRPDRIGDRAHQVLVNGSGLRPYLDYARFDGARKWAYTEYRAEPGEIYLSRGERDLGQRLTGAVVLEPNVKSEKQANKDWGFERWKDLVAVLKGEFPLVQFTYPGARRMLPGVRYVQTYNLREVAGLLSGARGVVLPEGGLHHCAAALGIPGVVIFGGYIHPKTTGYALHENLFTGGEACGMREPCRHCQKAMADTTPSMVAQALRTVLAKKQAA